jgi:DNA-binding MarR family transcriptional regulator
MAQRWAEGATFMSGGVPVRRSPIALARRFFQICTAASAEAIAGDGLTPLQLGVLAYLNRQTGEPGIDQNGLAARLGIDRASTSALVYELETMGLVERSVNGADRRARLLRLTPRGEKLRAKLHPASNAAQMNVFAALASREHDLLIDLLVRVIESNSALARPGASRRKRGFRQSPSDDKNPRTSSRSLRE